PSLNIFCYNSLGHSPSVLISLYLCRLSECSLTSTCCIDLSSALSALHSPLTELDLHGNKLENSGVTELCKGLRSENCKLEELRLTICRLTSGCCSALSSALSAPHSRLTELDLSDNELEDSGVTELCEGLRSKNCKIERLSLSSCHLTSRCCSALSSALSAPHSQLTELDLSGNKLGNSGVNQLCEGLRNKNCKIERLSLSECHLTSGCCSALSSVLSALHSRLTELDLSINQLGNSGVTALCKGLRSENCKLKTLSLWTCHLTFGCCSALSLALSAPHSPLTELHLNDNKLEDSGVDQLCEGLKSENCKLKTLWTMSTSDILLLLTLSYSPSVNLLSLYLGRLSKCGLTSGCCSTLSSALSAPHSQLTELDLSVNKLGDSGVDQLCEALRSGNFRLQYRFFWANLRKRQRVRGRVLPHSLASFGACPLTPLS
uniref:Uncharacterized protein n=1 Tax=Erpetoichthys calabaricus TaxID=27687 RepID=A0A8C4RE33_ERPCA